MPAAASLRNSPLSEPHPSIALELRGLSGGPFTWHRSELMRLAANGESIRQHDRRN